MPIVPSSPAALAGGQLALLASTGILSAGAAPEGLPETLGRVPDPRRARGRRYPVGAENLCHQAILVNQSSGAVAA
jgi:hypothetical protein